MARTVRDRKLDSRAARVSLPVRNAPYWCAISTGRALGYRKGRTRRLLAGAIPIEERRAPPETAGAGRRSSRC